MERFALGSFLKRSALPVGCALLLLYFGSHALVGSTGLLALGGIESDRTALLAENHKLMTRRAELARQIALLNPRGVDPDYADELIREQLGVVRPDEVIVPLHQ